MSTTRRFLIAGAAALVVLLAVGLAGWWFLIRGDAPPEVNLAAAVSTLVTQSTEAPTTEASPEPTAATTTTAAASTTTVAPAETGTFTTWVVDADAGSFVGYRVEEELASIGATTAVGRTPLVTGSMQIDGSAVTAVSVEADLLGLQSDDNRRDRAIRSQALETEAFPLATFELAEPIALPGEPAAGVTFAGNAVGDLTLHGVTQRVEVPVEGQFVDGAIVVVGSLPIDFADYDIDSPSSFVVLSVDDNGVVELQLVFRPT